ncbi:MAG: hypothetical protein GXO86_15375 [Chlorobi bacterium]|nr:hypothetical protein [Chlorobiota bacterium]
MKKLDQNWNGYLAEPINEKIIKTVENFIPDLEIQPQIFPTGRGTIQIEYYINDKNLAEIEIFTNEIYLYLIKNGEETEREIKKEEIQKIISDLYA